MGDHLGVLEGARGEAVKRGDTAGERTALAARVACWTALADLADTVHPAYGSACRQAAQAERAAMAGLSDARHLRAGLPTPRHAQAGLPTPRHAQAGLSAPRHARARSAVPGGWHPVPGPRASAEQVTNGPRHAQRDRVGGPTG